jgi:hypothetical protein
MATKFKVGDNCKILNVVEGFYHKDKVGQTVEIKRVLELTQGNQYETTAGFGNICEDRLELVDKYEIIREKTVKVFIDCEGNEHATLELAQKNNKKIEFFEYLAGESIYGCDIDLVNNCEEHRKAILKFLS